MAQQSARRGRKNQGFPPCHEHAVGDVVPVRELPYGPATWSHHRPDRWQHPTTCQTPQIPLATKGASTDGKRTFRITLRIVSKTIGTVPERSGAR